jgi:ferredoxin
MMTPVETTNFLPEVQKETCTGCGKCVQACPVEAMVLISANDAADPNRKTARLDEHVCLGCGVCVRVCSRSSIKLRLRPKRILTPVSTTHRAVLMAIEKGKLQNLIFDNQAHMSHRAMAAVLGVILKLQPVKQIMASNQMKSRYLEAIINRISP